MRALLSVRWGPCLVPCTNQNSLLAINSAVSRAVHKLKANARRRQRRELRALDMLGRSNATMVKALKILMGDVDLARNDLVAARRDKARILEQVNICNLGPKLTPALFPCTAHGGQPSRRPRRRASAQGGAETAAGARQTPR